VTLFCSRRRKRGVKSPKKSAKDGFPLNGSSHEGAGPCNDHPGILFIIVFWLKEAAMVAMVFYDK
jgi:hypothetical protein